MKLVIRICSFAALLLLTGCAAGYQSSYMEYHGQQLDWPTSLGAVGTTFDGVTIYYGYPPQHYTILGKIVQVNGSDHSLCWAAKEHGADAVVIEERPLISSGGTMESGEVVSHYNFGNSSQTFVSPSYRRQITFVTIAAWAVKLQPFERLDLIPVDINTNKPVQNR